MKIHFNRINLACAALLFIFFAGCTSLQNQNKTFNAITRNGKMSEIVLAFAQRQNRIETAERNETHPDGILFYFIIYPKIEFEIPALVELRDFDVNGTSYLELTRRNGISDIEPVTVIYDRNSFRHDERSGLINIRGGRECFIKKVTICGTALPLEGTINAKLFFGFDYNLEEFNFFLNIDDILLRN
jgi:hypothetical protein